MASKHKRSKFLLKIILVRLAKMMKNINERNLLSKEGDLQWERFSDSN